MIEFVWGKIIGTQVIFAGEEYNWQESKYVEAQKAFHGEYLETYYFPQEEGILFVGTGKEDLTNVTILKELMAKACKTLKQTRIYQFSILMDRILEENDASVLTACTEGICLGLYEAPTYKSQQEEKEFQVSVIGIPGKDLERAKQCVAEGAVITEAITFAREMVNRPGNKLRPADFAEEIQKLVKDTNVEIEIVTVDEMRKLEMGALLAVGESSAYPPYLVILRYRGEPLKKEITALVGKGVTCDTGGYCLKPASGMAGIRGDMAGAAAVAGAVYALAKRKEKVNVTAVMPLCENRISSGSFLPGDVITSYSGKTIEIGNTDAEGRLILADAVTYAIHHERATRILDIATLTGAVVNMLGFSIAGVLCDDHGLWQEFEAASEKSGEKYWLLPFGREHEKMMESDVADIKNIGGSVCGTIAAGLFIRAFAEGLPWIHLDIAGTAWTETPLYEFQNKYATGTAAETIYYWLKR